VLRSSTLGSAMGDLRRIKLVTRVRKGPGRRLRVTCQLDGPGDCSVAVREGGRRVGSGQSRAPRRRSHTLAVKIARVSDLEDDVVVGDTTDPNPGRGMYVIVSATSPGRSPTTQQRRIPSFDRR
jgi:hypothetical protein